MKAQPIRGVLFVGFGLILALWLISALNLVGRVVEVEKRTSDVQARFAQTEVLLSTLQKQILLGSVYLRDALLDTPESASDHRIKLERARKDAEETVVKYLPMIDSPDEAQTFAQLRSQMADFWDMLLPAVSWDAGRRAVETPHLLQKRVNPQRRTIISMLERVQRLNRAALEDQHAQMAGIYQAMRLRVWVTSLIMLLMGIAVALVVVRRVGRLERSIDAQRVREQQNARDLQRLSTKLVNAQEEERRTIARELHDEIGQALTAIKVELAMVERAIEPEARTRDVLREARSITDRALQAARDMSQLLHPPLLDDLGLAATLDWYLRRFTARTGIPVDLVNDALDGRVAGEIEVSLYRIVQEALTNVVKHAKATSCRVSLQRLPQNLLLTVEDDGAGFDVQAVTRSDRRGLGLLSIEERVAGFGGTFRIESVRGRGTMLTVEVPALERAQAC